jgi:hypothetical protein
VPQRGETTAPAENAPLILIEKVTAYNGAIRIPGVGGVTLGASCGGFPLTYMRLTNWAMTDALEVRCVCVGVLPQFGNLYRER